MTARRGLVPAEYLIVETCMAVANFGVVLRPPDITLNAKVLLPKRLDLARDAERAVYGVPGLIVARWAEGRINP
jgi:hypothetical protein